MNGTWNMYTTQTLMTSLGMVCSTVMANLLLKVGAGADQNRWFLGAAGSYTLAGVAFFGIALLLYAWILRTVPLSIAQSLTAAQFAGVILTSAYILSEPIPVARWIGVGCIMIGILLVGYSA